MFRRLKNLFKRKRAPVEITAAQLRGLTPSPPQEYIPGDLFPVDSPLESPETATIFNHGKPPPATRWSAPPRTNPSPEITPLYRDDCIRLHREVNRLHQDIDRLVGIVGQLEQERDIAKMGQGIHWENLQRSEFEVGQLRMENNRLRNRMDALERHRWRRAMRARVEAAEIRAADAEEELGCVRRQFDDAVHEKEGIEHELLRVRDRMDQIQRYGGRGAIRY